MDAMTHRYPNALIQFEDFQTPHALPLLNKYRDTYRMFVSFHQQSATTSSACSIADRSFCGPTE